MKKTKRSASPLSLVGVVFAVSLFVFAAPPQPGMSGLGDPMRGQSLFAKKRCVECHAVRGEGGRLGPDLGRRAVKGSFYEIASGLWNHSIAMREKMQEFRVPQPTFEDGELADLIAFLYFLNYFDEAGDPSAGSILFTQKHCIQCHQVEGVGGDLGPSMDTLARGTSPLRIAQDLWNHGPRMVTAMRSRGLNVPKFEGSEIIDLLAYLRSHGRRRGAQEFQSAGDPARGESLFRSKGCRRCHGVFGSGREMGPDLGRAELRGSVTQIAGRMWNHWPEMAEAMEVLEMRYPSFSGEDLADILSYILVTRYDGQGGDPLRGRDIYTEKGCSLCHSLDGTGGIGPGLRGLKEGKEALTQRMWNHAPLMWQEMASHKLPWPRFEAQELADLLAFFDSWPSGSERASK